MPEEQFQKLVLQKFDEMANEQKEIRSDASREHKEIREMLSGFSERLLHAEWKLKLQQTGLYAISAAIGAGLWKVPALLTWIKTHLHL